MRCACRTSVRYCEVKVRLQTSERGVYNEAIDCLRKGIARERLQRVYFIAMGLEGTGMLMCRAGTLCWCLSTSDRRDAHVDGLLSPISLS